MDLVSLQENFDTTTAIGRGVVRIVMVFAQLEREQTSERTADIMKHMAKQGRYIGRTLPLGYDNVDKALVVNEPEAAIVKEVFETYIREGSLLKTAQALNKKGYRMKKWITKAGKERGGGRFSKDSVNRMLRDKHYIGQVVHKGQAYEGQHEGFVDEALFQRVQEILDQNRVTATGARHQHTFLLKGLVRCAACDKAMIPAASTGRHGIIYKYYRCLNDQGEYSEKCPIGSVNAEELENLVVQELKELAKDPRIVEGVVEEACGQSAQEVEEFTVKRRGLLAEANELKEKAGKVVNVLARYGDQGDKTDLLMNDLQDFRTREKALRQEADILEFQIQDAASRVISAETVREHFKLFKRVWDHLTTEEQAELMQLLVRRITYFEGPAVMGRDGKRKKKVYPGKVRVDFWDLDALEPLAALTHESPEGVHRLQGLVRRASGGAPRSGRISNSLLGAGW